MCGYHQLTSNVRRPRVWTVGLTYRPTQPSFVVWRSYRSAMDSTALVHVRFVNRFWADVIFYGSQLVVGFVLGFFVVSDLIDWVLRHAR